MFHRHLLFRSLFFVAILGLVIPVSAQSEDPPIELRLRRDFGYGSGLQVQGRFSMRVNAPEAVQRVEFLVDGSVVGDDGEAPFIYRFHTDDFELGWHTLEAVGHTTSGEALPSNPIRREFVPQSTATFSTIAILGVVMAIVVLRFVLTRDSGATNYGMLGGTICPHCGRPFAYHIWSFNLIAGRFDRCRHCGKWSFTRRHSPDFLAEVERELDDEVQPEATAASEEERLRRQIDSSRFDDLV